MEESGFHWYLSLLVSLTVYTGAFQFVLTTLMAAGASWLTIAGIALFMNSRQIFYSLTFLEEFQKMGRKKPYMIHTMTDETYAVNLTLEKNDENSRSIMFYVALFSRIYWMVGAVAGGILGQLIPVTLDGIEFCMTALFVTIFIDQWEKAQTHVPALAGLVTGVLCLYIFGEDRMMLPALCIVSAVLILYNRRKEEHEHE
jgi:4-azaleucine resistance transporter AzlC